MTDEPGTPTKPVIARVKLEVVPPAEGAPDPFDTDRLRLSAATLRAPATTKMLTAEARKPSRTKFIRVHPDPAYTIDLEVLEVDRHLYMVDPDVLGVLSLDTRPVQVFTCVERTGAVFLWPISLSAGSDNPWVTTARDIAETAKTEWVRVASSARLGRYEGVVARITMPDPVWPDKPLGELLRLAFSKSHIDSLEHTVVRQLLGECCAYAAIWALDFEFQAPPGEHPSPLCMCALDLVSGRRVRMWEDELLGSACPFSTGPDTLFVGYFLPAEWGCFLELGWPLPARALDLFAGTSS